MVLHYDDPEKERLRLKKISARSKTKRAIRRGELTRQTCQACDSDACTHPHHLDYDDPLKVEWLCPSCHSTLHGRLRREANGR